MPDNENGTPVSDVEKQSGKTDTTKTEVTSQKTELLNKVFGEENKVESTEKIEITPKRYKLSDDIELDEHEVPTVLKIFKKDKIDDVVIDWKNNQDWKKRNADEGQRINAEKAVLEQERKQHRAEKEELANRQARIKEDLLKEQEIEKSYSEKIKAIKDEIKTKKESIDPDNSDEGDSFENFRDEKRIEIAKLELRKEQELSAHKAYMEKVELEEKDKQTKAQRQNLLELANTYPEEFSAEEIYKEYSDFKSLTPEQQKDPKTVESYSSYKKYLELVNFATNNQQISLARANELRILRKMKDMWETESKSIESKIAEARKAERESVIAEIKAKGRSYFESIDKNNKPIEAKNLPEEEKDFEKKKDSLLRRIFH